MCGIAGILMPDGKAVNEAIIRQMGAATVHRGPDNFGIYVKDDIGLAHNRLSIVDLSPAGNQPFVRLPCILVYNGEIYNQQELRETLRGEGIEPTSSSDTAALFEYLIRFGLERTLKDIRGMFAFAFCDMKSKEVFLCRDRYGIKPLNWTFSGGALYWGSEIKAIRAARQCEVDVTRSLFAVAAGTENSVYLTPFRNVFNVSPGHYLRATPGQQPTSHQYYDIANDVDEGLYRQLERCSRPEIVERFETVLGGSVKSLLMGDVPMGCFVSGGVDSSLITAVALEHDQNCAYSRPTFWERTPSSLTPSF
jgi:asparagine synthase (glutamine-hydrolysing)